VRAAGTFVGVGEWLDRRAQLSADRVALVDVATGARLSYRALNSRAHALAALLSQKDGIRAGDRVAVLAAKCPEYLDVLFASALLGATLVPLNWRLTVPELGRSSRTASQRCCSTTRRVEHSPSPRSACLAGHPCWRCPRFPARAAIHPRVSSRTPRATVKRSR